MNCDCALAVDMRSYKLCSGVFYLFRSLSWGDPRGPDKELADGEPRALGRVEEKAEGGMWCICESKEPWRREGPSACCR